jgi:hypothetical protein
MPWHVHVKLPDGRRAAADHRDPVVPIIRRIHAHKLNGIPVRPGDYAQVSAWLDEHTDQSRACADGTCGHD